MRHRKRDSWSITNMPPPRRRHDHSRSSLRGNTEEIHLTCLDRIEARLHLDAFRLWSASQSSPGSSCSTGSLPVDVERHGGIAVRLAGASATPRRSGMPCQALYGSDWRCPSR